MTEPELRALAARDAIPSAEEEAALRKWAAESARPDMLGELRGDVRRLLALIDAARAETAAVVRERDEALAKLASRKDELLAWQEGGPLDPDWIADQCEATARGENGDGVSKDGRALWARMAALFREIPALRSLAADLVEGLDALLDAGNPSASYCEECDIHAPTRADGEGLAGPLTHEPQCPVGTARALLTRAAALGVGKQDGEKEKGNG